MMENFDNMTKPIDISKELENINFKELLKQFPELKTSKEEISKITKHRKRNRWFINKKVYPESNKTGNEPKTQLVAFQKAMKLLIIIGQCLGLNPITGVLGTDVSKMRFSAFNWRFLYSILIGFSQAIGTVLTLYRFSKNSITVTALGYLSFYLVSCITTFVFWHLCTKWPALMTELANSSLNNYIDQSMKFKCYTACIVILILAAAEHILSLISTLSKIEYCLIDDTYDELLRRTFTWYYELGLPNNKPIGIFIQIINIISTINWNYSDMYILCLSMYLVSILEQINTKIILASENRYTPSARWRSLREDYCKATGLVRSFDDVVSGIVFISFASNLFFICLQVFNILAHGLKARDPIKHICPNSSGIFVGNEYTVYLGFSTVYLFVRSLTVSLVAASVNSASLAPAAALYNVPSSAFYPEVARFLDQVHANTVALSGLQFFYVTRELVLSVAGTIVTYELVVLQVSSDEIHSET